MVTINMDCYQSIFFIGLGSISSCGLWFAFVNYFCDSGFGSVSFAKLDSLPVCEMFFIHIITCL